MIVVSCEVLGELHSSMQKQLGCLKCICLHPAVPCLFVWKITNEAGAEHVIPYSSFPWYKAAQAHGIQHTAFRQASAATA